MRNPETTEIDPEAIQAELNEQREGTGASNMNMDSATAAKWLLQRGADMGIIEDMDSVVEMLENVDIGRDAVYKKRHGGTVGIRKNQAGRWSPIPVERRFREPV